MIADTALLEKRAELKRRLASGEYKTLVDVFLSWFERLLRNVARRTKPLPLWLTSTTLVLLASFIGFIAIYLTGDLINATSIFNQFGVMGNLLVLVLLGGQAVISAIAINQLNYSIFSLVHDKVLDSAESIETLDNLRVWLEMTCNKRQHFFVSIFGGILAGLYATSLLNIRFFFSVGYGSTITIIIFSIFSTAFLYLLYMILLLSARLRGYDLELFSPDPSGSELIARLSSKLNLVVYIVGVYAAIMTLIFVVSGFFTSAGILLVLALWLPIIALFILNQTSLASIIRRAKWKMLNEIQSQVEELRKSNNLKDKETMEAINRLMDFHDRVKATRNSAIDSSTIINFVNSLLLPLLAFLLGNLDKVLAIFSK